MENFELGSINCNEVDTILYREETRRTDTSENSGNDEKGLETFSHGNINRKVCFHRYKAKSHHVIGCESPKSSSDIFTSERETSASSPELGLSDADGRIFSNEKYWHIDKSQSYTNTKKSYKDLSNNESNSDTDLHYKEPCDWQPPNTDYLHRIASIVEYYLSDDNLAKDMFLLKHVTKYQGFISLRLISKYKKVKRICKDWRNVKFAIKTSDKLELNEEETKVRRCEPLSPDLESRSQFYRSILAYDIPSNIASIVKVAEIFGAFGIINSIHLYKPGGKKPPNFHRVSQKYPHITSCVCAIIEFEENKSAFEAIKSLQSNFNTPIKVMELYSFEIWSNKQCYQRKGLENESSYYSASDIENEEFSQSPCHYKSPYDELSCSGASSYKFPIKEYSTLKSEPSYNFVQSIPHSTKYRNYPDHQIHTVQIYQKCRCEQRKIPSPDFSRINNNKINFGTSTNSSSFHNKCLKNCFEKAKSRMLHSESNSCPSTPVTSPPPFRRTFSHKPSTNIYRTPYGPDGSKGFHNRCNSK